jgi:hypothetical protein
MSTFFDSGPAGSQQLFLEAAYGQHRAPQGYFAGHGKPRIHLDTGEQGDARGRE